MQTPKYFLPTFCLLTLACVASLWAAPQPVTFAYEDKHNFPFYIGNSEQVQGDKPGIVEFLTNPK